MNIKIKWKKQRCLFSWLCCVILLFSACTNAEDKKTIFETKKTQVNISETIKDDQQKIPQEKIVDHELLLANRFNLIDQFSLGLAERLASYIKVSEVKPNEKKETKVIKEQQSGSTYYLRIFVDRQVVTAFSKDENGDYTVVARNMVCTTGASATPTPIGKFKAGFKNRWRMLMGACFGQYITQFKGNYYFHSVPLRQQDPSTVSSYNYSQLGGRGSHGCVRLLVKDAKWLYYNCPTGTPVEVLESSSGFSGIYQPAIPAMVVDGWDPTDDDPNNPSGNAWEVSVEPEAMPEVVTPEAVIPEAVMPEAVTPEATMATSIMEVTPTAAPTTIAPTTVVETTTIVVPEITEPTPPPTEDTTGDPTSIESSEVVPSLST